MTKKITVGCKGLPADGRARAVTSEVTGVPSVVTPWSALAAEYTDQNKPLLASLAYGCAKFRARLTTRATALTRQTEAYPAAAPTFGIRFERRVLTLPSRSSTVDLPVHLYTAADSFDTCPVLMISGGVPSERAHRRCVRAPVRRCRPIRGSTAGGTDATSRSRQPAVFAAPRSPQPPRRCSPVHPPGRR